MSTAEIEIYIETLSFIAQIVVPSKNIDPRLTDQNDQAVLGTLLGSQDANYLITGDKALLALSDFYSIITPAEFWLRHGS